MRHKYLFTAALVAALVSALLLTFPAPGTAVAARPAANTPQITITGTDYAYDLPAQIYAGLVAINFVNQGKEPHQAQIARLQDGKTVNDLQTALKQPNLGPAMSMLTFPGGANTVDPGGSQRVVLNLTPGNYVVICFVQDEDGTPHFAKGMIKPFQVVAANNNGTAEPKVDANVSLKDFAITLPASIRPGQQTWHVINNGPQPHEMDLLKLAPGKTAADVQAFFQKPAGPPPFQDVGGMGGLTAGQSGWVDLNLLPGNYIAICMIPDAATGKPHFELGMIQPFSVPGGLTAAPADVPETGGALNLGLSTGLAGALLLIVGFALLVFFRSAKRDTEDKRA